MIMLMSLVQTVDAAGVQQGIGTGALVFMLVCMATVTTLTAWCFSRVLRTKEHFDPDGTGPARSPVPGRKEGES